MWLVSHSGCLLVVDVSAEQFWSFLPSASSPGQKLCKSEIVSSSLSFGLTGKKNQLQLYQRTTLAFCLQTNVAAQRTVRWGDTQCFAWIKLERNPRLGLRIRLLHNCTCRSPPRHPAKQRSENNRGTNDGRGSQNSITKCSMRYVLMDLVSVLESKDTTHGFWLWSATTRTTNCCKTLHHIATILHLVAPLYLLRILVCKIFVETMTEQNYLGKDLVLSALSAL
jgi:hypothetical protein